MAAGVVDDLELVEVKIAEDVFDMVGMGAVDGLLQTVLEFIAVVQAGEGVMAGEIVHVPGHGAGFPIPGPDWPAGKFFSQIFDDGNGFPDYQAVIL